MVREILLLGHPLLWQSCEPVQLPSDVTGLLQDLRDTLDQFRRTHGFGRGIAAPQIGQPLRAIYIEITDPLPMINPEIVSHSDDRIELWDDCFSFPDILVKVHRWRQITVRYLEPSGRQQSLTAHDDLSELLQHEIDHINGILAIDRRVDEKSLCLRSEFERRYRRQIRFRAVR